MQKGPAWKRQALQGLPALSKQEVTYMSTQDIERKCRELRELQALIAEAEAEAEAVKDALKRAMGDTEELRAGEYKLTWRRVTAVKLDTKALRAALPDVAARFSRESTVRRFCVA